MLNLYLKQVFRSFKAKPLLFFVSILTLLLGTLSISLLTTYVHNELSMNKFHHKGNDIYMMITQASPNSRFQPIEGSVFFGFNYKDYPELKSWVSLKKYPEGRIKLTYNKLTFSPEGIVADSSFFRVFDFDLKIGNKKTILADPDAMILSEQLALKIFGPENPIGKVIKFNGNIEKSFTVKAIASNIPSNSSITFDFILPNSTDYGTTGADFIVAKKGFNRAAFIQKIEKIGQKHPQFTLSKTSLVALNDVYFNEEGIDLYDLFSRYGDRKSLNILYIIIGILLVVSALNFSNIQIINDNLSIKKLGVSKILGARSYHIVVQKFIEILCLIGVSTLIISLAFILLLPYFNSITGVRLAPGFPAVLSVNLLVLTVMATLSMIYPVILLTRHPFALIFKRHLAPHRRILGRQISVVAQFTLSIVLIVASIVVGRQLNMMLDKDLGFNTENIIETKLFQRLPFNMYSKEELDRQIKKQRTSYQHVKDELSSNTAIEMYSQQSSPIEKFPMPWKTMEPATDYTSQNTLAVTPSHLKLFGFELTEGHFFDQVKDQSRANKVVINEAARKYWNISDISNASLNNKYWEHEPGYEIIGVVKDFNYEHLSVKPKPMVMVYFEDIEAPFLIKLKKGAEQAGLQFVKQLHDQLNENEVFQYSFVHDRITEMYQKEKQLSLIYILFTLVAILISISGLFIIALYDATRRTKEIGIRKVNGATISEVITMLNGDFVRWVVVAFVIATPIAYYAMNCWLEGFAYKTTLSWWIFALAGLLALGIALLTVSWQSWKAATRNPVEALRYE